MAVVGALEVDRVGLYSPPKLQDLALAVNPELEEVWLEERGSYVANWTARHKLTQFLNARAQVSRGLLFLALACLFAAFTVSATQPDLSSCRETTVGPAKESTSRHVM